MVRYFLQLLRQPLTVLPRLVERKRRRYVLQRGRVLLLFGANPRQAPMRTQCANCCFIGNAGTGKTHLAISLDLAACRQGRRVRFFTAATLVNRLEESQKQYQLERFLTQLDKTDLLIVDELGYLSFSRVGAELLFQVFTDRYERKSLLLTSNLPFREWAQIFQGERMTAALLDRLTHRCHIFE